MLKLLIAATTAFVLPTPRPRVTLRFEIDEYPATAEELIDYYGQWTASKGDPLTPEEAKRDVQAFMANEDIANKWRPVFLEAAKERNKLTFAEAVNLFSAYALPFAVGLTFLPILRRVAENVPFVNDAILPALDDAWNFGVKGVKRIFELPFCVEFGDC